VEQILPVDLRVPGCPPAPDAIAAALAELCDR
jgi:NADH:ubiquinone oxidoreductase subunit B-like Fe-S oxidoreductase